MEPVRSNGANQSYYDPTASMCVAEPSASETRSMSEAPAAPPTPQSTEEDPDLCRKRLATNRLICSLGGSLIGGQLPLGGVGNAIASFPITAACNELADWLEYNAPLGACGDR